MARFKGRSSGGGIGIRRRFQLLVTITIIFMLTISFLILKPELFSSSAANSENVGNLENHHGTGVKTIDENGAEVIVNRIDLPAAHGKLPAGNLDGKPMPVHRVIEEMSRAYSVDFGYQLQKDQSPWEIAAKWANSREVLPEHAPELGAILNAMATAEILAVGNGIGGTQLKLSMKLSGDQTVAFKPKWYERDHIIEGTPYAGRDRHNGEIAAFHLSRILGFRRTPLAIGRVVDLRKDIAPVASQELWKTFYEEGDDVCFYGKCHYCNKENSVCADGDKLEGTVILWLPNTLTLKTERHPWRRLYREKLQAKWEKDESYCSIVRQIAPYQNNSYILLDIIDTAIFDFLISNADRHHYDVVKNSPDGMLVMLDNGKSFGNPNADERSILAPLYQCCSIRYSTWQRLLSLQHSILSSVLNNVLTADPIFPILTRPHLDALDRRLDKVLQEVQKCIDVNGMNTVVMDFR